MDGFQVWYVSFPGCIQSSGQQLFQMFTLYWLEFTSSLEFWSANFSFLRSNNYVHPLKPTLHLKIDGWKTIFLLREGLFSKAMLVFGRVVYQAINQFVAEDSINFGNWSEQAEYSTPTGFEGWIRVVWRCGFLLDFLLSNLKQVTALGSFCWPFWIFQNLKCPWKLVTSWLIYIYIYIYNLIYGTYNLLISGL